MDHLEIEVKFYLKDLPAMRRQIVALGADDRGRSFETNVRFEDAAGGLIRKKQLLRLRKDRKTTLTFKAESGDPGSEFKIHRELEVEVADFQAMKHILAAMGFHPEQTYEKWRETFVLDRTVICLDSMPYGNFIEIEGQKTKIRDTARRLGLKWEDRILLNYLAMFDIIKRRAHLDFKDVTFEHFTVAPIDIQAYLSVFREKTDPP